MLLILFVVNMQDPSIHQCEADIYLLSAEF